MSLSHRYSALYFERMSSIFVRYAEKKLFSVYNIVIEADKKPRITSERTYSYSIRNIFRHRCVHSITLPRTLRPAAGESEARSENKHSSHKRLISAEH